MHLKISNLIIGGGYAGLMMQSRLASNGRQSVILDKGSSTRFADKDYVVICHKPMPFTYEDPINLATDHVSSNTGEFNIEYSRKLYNRDLDLNMKVEGIEEVYAINNDKLLDGAQIYGNIEVTSIDTDNKIVKGKVLHFGSEVTIQYDNLFSTIPIYEFAKLTGLNLLEEFGIFISFFPIGVIKRRLSEAQKFMSIGYYSDPLIPYYRRHMYGNSVFLEYCINKPFHGTRFDKVIKPGKFIDPDPTNMRLFYEVCAKFNVYFAGRFATWDSGYTIEDIYDTEGLRPSTAALNGAFE